MSNCMPLTGFPANLEAIVQRELKSVQNLDNLVWVELTLELEVPLLKGKWDLLISFVNLSF